tara:strand:+ start:617 stop:1192 length:576 start_codon:yes stop_codon:yes gene_type:complete
MIQKVKINQISSNPNNPRLIRDDKFKKLVKSIIEFPEMLELRPIVVDEKNIILGGNMRYKACQQIGLKEVYIIKAENLTEEQLQQFVIKDNVGFGEWDWDILANTWKPEELKEWGLDVWQPESEVDYSILDDEDLSTELNDMTDGVKKAIQIEFEAEDYEEAQQLVKFWRDGGAYIGSMIIEHLKNEKNKV